MNVKTLAKVSMIAALYTIVSLAFAPLTYGNIQIRIAEALTLLPLLDVSSIYGITLGCFLTNLLGAMWGFNPLGFLDAAVGTPATLLAGLCTYALRNHRIKGVPVYSMLMPIVFNFVFVGIELAYLFFPNNLFTGWLICGSEVAIGELVAVIVGYYLLKALEKTKLFQS